MGNNYITQRKEVENVSGTTRIHGRTFDNTAMLRAAVGASNIHLYNFTSDDRVLAWWGITTLRLGAAELWIIVQDGVGRRDRIIMAANARRVVEQLMASGHYFRLEMAVSSGDTKWAEFLGFEFSHVCRRYDGENDQLIYVREA